MQIWLWYLHNFSRAKGIIRRFNPARSDAWKNQRHQFEFQLINYYLGATKLQKKTYNNLGNRDFKHEPGG